jgi:hypothetical protein
MAKITGRVEVVVNGELLLNKPGAVASGIGVSGEPAMERAAVIGDTGLHGFTQNPIMAQCEVTITDRDDISLSDLAAINGDGTVVFRSSGGGKVYTMNNATCLGNFTLTGGEGETSIVFQGPGWVETTSEV